MITFATEVRIERPLDEVFAYVSEPLNFPHWNSAVQSVRKTAASEHGVGSTYLMERELPSGRAVNRLEVVASEPPRQFAIRAIAGPTPFLYRYRFSSENGETVVSLGRRSSCPARRPSCRTSRGAPSRAGWTTTSRP